MTETWTDGSVNDSEFLPDGYEERLNECGVTTLEERRLRGIKYKCLIY